MPFGTGELTSSTESVVALFKGGRLQTWHTLTDAQRDDYSAQHVELMLGVAHEHGMMTLEGFKLMEPKQPWERFWVLEFPTLEGAEAWIEAEMAPPYGTYGYYEYHLARRFAEDYFNDWVTTPRSETEPLGPVDPSNLPRRWMSTVIAVSSWSSLECSRMRFLYRIGSAGTPSTAS